MSNTTLYECAASVFGPLGDGSGCVSAGQRDMVAWMVERDVLVSLTDERGDDAAVMATAVMATAVVATAVIASTRLPSTRRC
jgi:hypothetical protein